MYPPVIPVSVFGMNFTIPDENSENTGTPTIPRSIYTTTAIVPRFRPSTPPVTQIANVCSVNGTGPSGIVIHVHTMISATNIAIIAKSLTDNIFFSISFSSFLCLPKDILVLPLSIVNLISIWANNC